MKRTLMAIVLTGLFCFYGIANAAPVQWATNGHWYEIIDSNISWEDAKTIAANAGGYLATITTSEEQQFLASLLASHVQGYATISGYMIGGFQPAGSQEPSGNWQWVKGESWVYTNWGSGEPNNSGGENYLYMDERYGWAWNDYTNFNNWYGQPSGYIVEFSAVPEPATMLLLGFGLMGLAGIRRKLQK